MRPLRSFLGVAIAAALSWACSDVGGPSEGPANLTIVDGNNQTGPAGENLPTALSVKVVNAEGIPLRGVDVTWAITAGNGTVTPKGPTTMLGIATAELKLGTTTGANTVQATSGSAPAVTFTAIGVAGTVAVVKVSRDSFVTRVLGDTVRLSATVTDKFNNSVSNATVQWSSSDTAVARVASNGLLTVRGRGRATITAKAGAVQGTMGVRVIPVARVVATPELIQLHSINQTYQVTVAALDAGGVNMAPFNASFTSLSPGTVSVAANGQVKAVANGTALVVADVEGFRDTVVVTVTQVIKTAAVQPARVNVPVTTTTQLSGLALDSLGTAVPGVSFAFTSADPTTASVSSTGMVTGVRLGSTTVTATSGSLSGTAEINVTALLANVAAGSEHTCAAGTSGPTETNRAFCWGKESDDMRLGNIFNVSTNVPTAVLGIESFALLEAGALHTCGLNLAGFGFCWGTNDQGQFGDGTTVSSANPAPVGGPQFSSISAGWRHTCAVGQRDSTVYCWGNGANGELGVGTVTTLCGTDPCATAPLPILSTLKFSRVSAGLEFSCAIEAVTGNAYCWGTNQSGQLGTGNNAASSIPVLMNTSAKFVDISAGDYFACGVTTDGAIMCWGHNDSYQIGLGTRIDSNVPVSVSATGPFLQVSAGGSHACARNASNAIYCWGANTFGQLGNNSTISSSVGQLVAGSLQFTAVTAGKDHTCASSTTNVLYCWGRNTDGQLGTGDNLDRRVPTQVH